MEDSAIKAVRNDFSDLRVEIRAAEMVNAARMERIILLLEGDPADKKRPGLIRRIEDLEETVVNDRKEADARLLRLEVWQKKIATYIAVTIVVIAAGVGVFKFFQSIK
jgi:hypothetical protein